MKKTARAEIKRQKLLDEGVSILTTQGYHGTGIKALMANASISKGSFYNYFESKEEFCSEVIKHYAAPFITQLDSCLAASNKNALLAIQNYFDLLIDELEASDFLGGCLIGNLLGEMSDTNNSCLKELRNSLYIYRDKLKESFLKAQKEGFARSDVSAETMANMIIYYWQGALLRMKVDKSTKPLKECCDHLLGDYFKA